MNDQSDTSTPEPSPSKAGRPYLGCPAGVPARLYAWWMGSALALALSLGVQAIVTAVIVAGPRKPRFDMDDLTVMGSVMVHPSHDMPAYVAGLAFASILLALTAWVVRMRAPRLARIHEFPEHAAQEVIPAAILRLTLAIGSLALFLVCVEAVRRSAYDRWVTNPLETALLLAPLVLSVTALLVHTRGPALWPAFAGWAGAPPLWMRRSFDIAVLVGIVLLIFVPPSAELAGRIYLREQFIHLDYFAIGPATQYALGAALGTDAFSLYGIGFPFVLGAMDPLLNLSHQRALHLLIAYGCLYFFGVYALARALKAGRPAAALAVALALLFTFFAPIWARIELATLWQWPSTSILRAPTDVWLFLALAMHARTAGPVWLVAAAVAAIIGIFFITDTGLGLLIVLTLYAFYWLVFPRPVPSPPGRPLRIAHTAVAILTGALALVLGLYFASRGTLITATWGFLNGWLEASLTYGGIGMGNMHFLSRVSLLDIAVFMALVSLAFVALTRGGLRALSARPAADEVVIALLGFYALGRLLYFLYRTLPNNLYHAAIPVAVLLVVLGARYGGALCVWWARHAPTRAERLAPRFLRAAIPVPLLALAGAGIWYSPAFQDYPGALRVIVRGTPDPGLHLIPERNELGGIAPGQADRVENFAAAVERMRSLHDAGHAVAVVDHTATIYHLTARVPAWGRDIGAYYNILFWEQMEAYQAAMKANPPDYILIRSEVPNQFFEDSWRSQREFLDTHARVVDTAGLFDVYAWQEATEDPGDVTAP